MHPSALENARRGPRIRSLRSRLGWVAGLRRAPRVFDARQRARVPLHSELDLALRARSSREVSTGL